MDKKMRAIFIGGCPRSGTTLLASLLAGHPDYGATPETPFKRALHIEAINSGGEIDWRKFAEKWKGNIHFRTFWDVSASRIDLPKSVHWKAFLEKLVKLYVQEVYHKNTCSVWIDHTTSNIKLAYWIFEHFPGSRMIHIVRDGRAVAVSFRSLPHWGPKTILAAARWWREFVLTGLLVEQAFPKKVLRVKYEDLVSRTEDALIRICEWADLEFHPQMLTNSGYKVPEWSQSQHNLIGKAIQNRNRWEQNLSAREREIFESINSDLLKFLSYPQEFTAPKPPSIREIRRMNVTEFFIAQILKVKRFLSRRLRYKAW